MGSPSIAAFFTLFIAISGLKGELCPREEEEAVRYLLYDVNYGEGFNLRRDVYVRIANLVRKLSQDHNWVLLVNLLPSVSLHRFVPDKDFLQQWGDGGAAIVDQIICSHARYFVGSYESTFSFRIQEEREILGFTEETTFNRLCGSSSKCEQPAKWRIISSHVEAPVTAILHAYLNMLLSPKSSHLLLSGSSLHTGKTSLLC
ncbi:GDP-fucose protein O-fucosyltransferase 2 [Portunus trituberculatus]|uniref:GDP-fucose protein O-fucosyltransferase 2 n=1 Tax=Portunus trituberculatus TaxID=210409 RepID=A0A5B7D3P5_PORTR|nr:GDP-fucose protein O-fucosyltransferase 2 [Portunus trituberculatus]